MKVGLISRMPLFASLMHHEVELLATELHERVLDPGEMLFHEGERGDTFYIVAEGEVEIIKALGTPDERFLGTRASGECFGEICLLHPDRTRTASVRARTAVILLEMAQERFRKLLEWQPAVAFEMARSLSNYLRESDNAVIRDLHEKNEQLARAYEELKAAQAQILEKERLEHELLLAREIQESMLPRTLPTVPGYEFGARMVAAKAVGGDLYDFMLLDDATVGIAIGDVSGKGVPAALFMAMTRSLLRAEAAAARSPREVLLGVNRHLLSMNDAGMFVTILYGVLDPASRRFHYARAGHPLPILCDALGTIHTPCVKPGQPVGLLSEPELDQQFLEIPAGSTLILHTDGMTDAGSDAGELFGGSRLHREIGIQFRLPPQALCDQLIKVVLDYSGESRVQDDMALVALRAAL